MDAKLLTWKEARIIIDHYFSFWRDGEDKVWAKMHWHAIENAGLTIYRTDEEEIVVRSRISILALIYQEFCELIEYSQFTDTYFKPLQEHHYKEIFSDSIEKIDEQIYLVLAALLKELPSSGLFLLALESAIRGSHGSMTFSQVDLEVEESKKRIQEFGTCEYRAYRFLDDAGYSINEFNSCSGLGYFK